MMEAQEPDLRDEDPYVVVQNQEAALVEFFAPRGLSYIRDNRSKLNRTIYITA
jgi:hypothetical protein